MTLTVFTPTFNRGYVLPQLYESLTKQTSRDFVWLLIDDGSSDNTRELANQWIAAGEITIEYHFKENGGMHTAHNLAYDLMNTELNVCIDSDDFMPDDSVAKIIDYWNKNKDENYAGILGLDAYKSGDIVSNRKFPEGLKDGKYFQLKGKYGLRGDIKFVYRTETIKKYPPYPVFPSERFVPLGYKYLLIDQDYDMLFLNEVLCIVEYLEDGSSRNIFRQYVKNPKGFVHERKVRMKLGYTLRERFMNCVHYVSSSIFLRNGNFLSESTNKWLTILAIPLGIVLNIYIRIVVRKSQK